MSQTITVNLGAPGDRTLTVLTGATRVGDFLFVFAQAADGSLWARFWYNVSWQPWTALFPLAAPAGGLELDASSFSVISAGNAIWVYAVGKDKAIWCALWTESTKVWQWIAAPGNPPTKELMKATVLVTANPHAIYAVDTADKPWCAVYNGSSFQWASGVKRPLLAAPGVKEKPRFESQIRIYWERSARGVNGWAMAQAVLSGGVSLMSGTPNGGPLYTDRGSWIALDFWIDGGNVRCDATADTWEKDVAT